MDLKQYCFNLKDIMDTLEILNKDLNIFLNEIYIIDELIKIIEIFNYRNNDKINDIKKYLRKNVFLIQEFSNINPIKLSDELIKNFEEIYKKINNDEEVIKNYIYYDNLRYILFKEIKKISDINYQRIILEKLIEENVKRSIDIFQIFSINYLKQEIFENNINYFIIKEKLLIIFEHKNIIYGQIGNINTNPYEENIFDIDYLISVKKIESKDKEIDLLNDFLKEEENYNNLIQNLYDSNQKDCFEYKISDKLILNILNFRKAKENKYLNERNPFFYINNVNYLKTNNNILINNNQKYNSISNNKYQLNKNKDDEDLNHKLESLVKLLDEEKQKNLKLEKELNLVKSKVKELEGKEEKDIAINFISLDEKINYPMKCKSNDIFLKAEEILYYEYPEYNNKNLIFTLKGKVINKNETLEKNGIKNGDSIFLNY